MALKSKRSKILSFVMTALMATSLLANGAIIKASAATGGQVRVRGNNTGDWQSTALTGTPVDVTYTYTQSATGGNLQIDTGNTAVGTAVVITDLKITDNKSYTWAPDFSALTDPGTTADGQFISDAWPYQYGIQAWAVTQNQMTISTKSGALYVTATDGQYKSVSIETGEAVGGTGYYASQGFKPTADVEYTVTFKASIKAPVTGQVRVRGNNTGDWQSTDLTTTPVDVTYTYTQSVTGGNLQIDTGTTATGIPVVITDLKITDNKSYTWAPDFSALTDPGTTADGQFISDAWPYQYGIQAWAVTQNQMTISTKSGALYVTATDGQYKSVSIETGEAVGGTGYYASQGFKPTADVEYTVTFKASVIDPSAAVTTPPLPIQQDIPSLKDELKPYFTFGGEVEPPLIKAGSLSEQLVKKHYAITVPGNEMKPDSLEHNKGTFNWGPAEQVVDYAKENGLLMRGHTLVWHSQVPDWMFRHPDTPTDTTTWATHDELIANETKYITDVLTHFIQKYGTADGNTTAKAADGNPINKDGKTSPIKYFDAVNEVISDSADFSSFNANDPDTFGGLMRKDPEHPWFEIGGLDYIKTAFEVANKLDPSLKLFINDYGTENNNTKTTAEIALINQLLKEGIPVGGIGMQMHMKTNTDISAVKASIEKFAALKLPIQVTELDMEIADSNITPASLAQQALVYKQLFDVLKSEKQYINAVLFWGVTDNDTWLTGKQPLLFDSQYQAKPAYWGIVDPSKVSISRQSVQAVEGTPADANDKIWGTVKPIAVNTYAKGISGATGSVKVMWDSKNLYLKAAVTDATVGSNDSIDLYLDKAGSKATSYQPDANYKHLTIKRSDAVSDANGYSVYKTIPIDDINPALNGVLGFDARVNDDQGTGTVVSQTVFNDYGNRQDTNAAFFGDLKLGGPSKLANAIYGTPTVDGTIDSMWNNVNNANTMTTDTWQQGTTGATAKVKTMWDDKNLYVLAEVTDSLLNKGSANAWEQDSVEIFVDQNNNKTSSYEADDNQLRVNYDNEQTGGTNGIPAGFKSATKLTDTGYVIEESIPLSTITPVDGTILGFDAQVNNADDSNKRVSTASWCDPTGNGWASTASWGNLQLVDNRIHVTGVTLDKTSAYLNKGETLQLTATVSPSNPTNGAITWASSNTTVATVDASGKVTAVAYGNANITVTTADGSKTAVCAVSVVPTVTDTKDITDAITAAPAGGNVAATVEGSKVADKSIFDTLKGQDKSVTFVGDGATWTFNGKDITNATKSIDLTVKVTAPADTTSANKDGITKAVNGKDALVISFADNGVLPGPAAVTINVGSKFANSKSIYFYYYNPTTKKLELVAGPLTADANGNLTVTVTHNSDYVVVNEKLPKTGSMVDFDTIVGFGMMLCAAGVMLLRKKRIE